MKYNIIYINEVDILRTTSSFNSWAQDLFDSSKDKKVVFRFRFGNRSKQTVSIFKANGHKGAINHTGRNSYSSKIIKQ